MSSVTHSERLSSSDPQSFGELLAIYRDSIPSSEQKPPAVLRAMLESPDYRFIVHRVDGHVAAFAIVFVSSDPPFALLEYMAVAEADRGRGLGSRLFRDTLDLLRQTAPAVPLLIEVESDGPDDAGRQLRRRRQRFYGQLGCRRIEGLKYILPLETDPPAPQMQIMVHCDETSLPRDRLERQLRALYTRVYGRAEDDPRLNAMLTPLPQTLLLRFSA